MIAFASNIPFKPEMLLILSIKYLISVKFYIVNKREVFTAVKETSSL